MATSEAVKLARLKIKAQDRERAWDVISSPTVLRVLTLVTLLGTTRLVRDTLGKDNMGWRDIAAGSAAIGSVLLAADAGVKDRWALGAIAGATGMAVGEGKAGVVAIGKGAWESDALVRIDPTEFSSIFGGGLS